MNKETKLKGRDLINIGIYGAIYFVILFAVAMLGMIPIFLPLLSVFVPILGGIPFMLFLTRVKKPGMIFIFAMIMGILMLLTGIRPGDPAPGRTDQRTRPWTYERNSPPAEETPEDGNHHPGGNA